MFLLFVLKIRNSVELSAILTAHLQEPAGMEIGSVAIVIFSALLNRNSRRRIQLIHQND